MIVVYVLLGLFLIQAALTCYTLYLIRDLETRLKDVEGYMFDV